VHRPFPQAAERRAEAERRPEGFPAAPRELGAGRLLLQGLGPAGRAGGRLDVQVLQDVVVNLGGDLLLLQHLPDGLVRGVGSDRGVPPRGSSGLGGVCVCAGGDRMR